MSRISKHQPEVVKKLKALLPAAAEQASIEQRKLIEQAKKSLEPWEQCPDVWKTKASFFQWIRGQMRRAWSRHPVKVSYMANHRERVPLGKPTKKNPTGLVWGCRCEHCNELFKQTECEVDHIHEAGSFKGWEDFEAWIMKLMHINWDGIRVVCKECHRIISYAARTGMTFERAAIEKQAVAYGKLSVKKQIALLAEQSKYPVTATNAKQRRAAYTQLLLEKL